ncbi:MAG TPA: hypothetical protein VMJ10_07790 [Kofleriaceae bacterium]|nr:hypothetical protein [Kofleriaceae bacterium]
MTTTFASIDRHELARVSGGAARVAATGDQLDTQMQMELQSLTSQLSNLQNNNNNNSSSSMMLPMMMMMMGGGGGSQAAAAPPPPPPSPTVVRVHV